MQTTIVDGMTTEDVKKRKSALIFGRKRSRDKIRNFKSTLVGLRNDTNYVLKISFVLSGRKLGSESYRILSNDSSRKASNSTVSSVSPKSSILESEDSIPSPIYKQLVSQKIDSFQEFNEQILTAKSSEELKILLKFKPQNDERVHKRLVILEFGASWCNICAQVDPFIDEIAEKYGNKSLIDESQVSKEIIFIRADVDECSDAAETFDINALPSFLIIEQSSPEDFEVFHTFVGQQATNITTEIESWLSNSVSILNQVE